MTLKASKNNRKYLRRLFKEIKKTIHIIDDEASKLRHEYEFENPIWGLSESVEELEHTLFDDPNLKIEITTNEN